MKTSSLNTAQAQRPHTPERLTGTAVPLGALYSKDYPVIGEFPVLADFADFCKKAGLGIIQLLPVNDTGTQSSPYSGLSAFALHPIYISLKALPEFAKLYPADKKFSATYDAFIKNHPYTARYNYSGILDAKTALLHDLYLSTDTAKSGKPSQELAEWISENTWIVNYSVYKNLKYKYMQASWKTWSERDKFLSQTQIKSRWDVASDKKEHLFYAWTQMRAAQQFGKSAQAVRTAGIVLKGDMPILMNDDSCDAWALPQIFNQDLRAGSPVDNENPTGQNWGFPTYNWKNLKKDNYGWWKDRLHCAERYYSAYRLDHVLGFFRIWAVPDRDTTAVLGHTEPYTPITRDSLHQAGFDDGRIRWLSQPHVQTSIVEDITWNHDSATAILSKLMNKLSGEELWLFKNTVRGDKDIYECDFGSLCNDDASRRIKDKLSQYWRNRCLIELEPDVFAPVWTYDESTSWATLSQNEKDALAEIIKQTDNANNALWEKQSGEILSALTGSVNMYPCGEDLGANLPCLPAVLDRNGILALRVIRWSRRWNETGQPFIPFSEFTPLSVATTSVHDSPTLRQWWQEDKTAVRLFIEGNSRYFGSINADYPFSAETAEALLKASSQAASVWCIDPLQDFLDMEKTYWLEKPEDERVNTPGSVNDFNWTYRIPSTLESLSNDKILIEKIKTISSMHTGGKK